MPRTHLPQELKSLVSWSVSLLGDAIKKQFGEECYKEIEKLRRSMRDSRSFDEKTLNTKLLKKLSSLQDLSDEALFNITHSYSCMLELINRCEMAYRTWRLRDKEEVEIKESPYAVVFVLTAHPTEARSPECLNYFKMIQLKLLKALEKDQDLLEGDLKILLQLVLQVPLARDNKPTVEDEAHHIFSFVLKDEILKQLIKFYSEGHTVTLRTWVGGDKDGHPGVNERTLSNVLNLSRTYLISYLRKRLAEIEALFHYRDDISDENYAILSLVEKIKLHLVTMEKVLPHDGDKVSELRALVSSLNQVFKKTYKSSLKPLDQINGLLWIFPALVLPLELREDSLVVLEAKKDKEQPIRKMLEKVEAFSKGFEPKWYARGLILSMCEQASHIKGAISLVKDVFGSAKLPVVPLFENQLALENSKVILDELFSSSAKIVKDHQSLYGSRFEVMLGYSDSSKENGVFASRLMIAEAMRKIEAIVKKYKLTPVFFHGSGGSVERGGGSIKEQTNWWTKSAINLYKATIQGEMVARNFSTSEVFSSTVRKIISQTADVKSQKQGTPLLKNFSKLVRTQYRKQVSDSEFLRMVEFATPYTFLSQLKIGSRPSKRKSGGLNLDSLRAIPWILCWTQTRSLFPTWWGVGSAWEELGSSEKQQMKKAFKENDLLASYIHSLSFTLAKVELGIFFLYLDHSKLEKSEVKAFKELFSNEYEKALKFVKALTGKQDLLWYRPWLGESIHLRSVMIHPLNLIQLISLERGNSKLLRETVTGIACGMLTTG
ncbi:MAG: phosphoenolpyruvate carboxylase [Bacteriovoracaceae bacterium]